jgi:hypothetical protein
MRGLLTSSLGLDVVGEWTDDTDNELVITQTLRLISSIEEAARARGLHLEFKFMNDATYTHSPFVASTLSSLKAASVKWDPEVIFQRAELWLPCIKGIGVLVSWCPSFSLRGSKDRLLVLSGRSVLGQGYLRIFRDGPDGRGLFLAETKLTFIVVYKLPINVLLLCKYCFPTAWNRT